MKKLVLIVIAGPNGSGKTSITGKVLHHDWVADCLYINPDNIARDHFGDWNSPEAVLKAARLAEQLREESVANGQSLIFETVLSAPDKISFLKKAKGSGYFIRLFFVVTESPAINAGRIARRVMEGGHDVPIAKISSRYGKSIAACSVCARLADRTYVYDNSVDGVEPQLLFRVADGVVVKEYSPVAAWAQPVLEAIKMEGI